jgi:hypothetical protein
VDNRRAGSGQAGRGAFNASVRVEVDTTGKPVRWKRQPTCRKDPHFIEKRVSSWQYQPAKLDGVRGHLCGVNACACR